MFRLLDIGSGEQKLAVCRDIKNFKLSELHKCE